jgi:hypothetical protein
MALRSGSAMLTAPLLINVRRFKMVLEAGIRMGGAGVGKKRWSEEWKIAGR